MKAKELMIGDWVRNDFNQVEKVFELRETQAMLSYNDLYDYDDLEPIPLTGEILENNGFREDDKGFGNKCYVCEVPYGTGDDDDYAYLCMTDFGKYWQMDVSLVVGGTQTNIPNCGVHHLQHMLTLLGIEIEIKLQED